MEKRYFSRSWWLVSLWTFYCFCPTRFSLHVIVLHHFVHNFVFLCVDNEPSVWSWRTPLALSWKAHHAPSHDHCYQWNRGHGNTGSPPVHETNVKAWKKALILWKKTRTFKVIDWIQELDWVTPPPLCSKQEVQTRLRHLTVVLNKLNVYCKKCRIQLSNSYWPVWFILNIVASLLLTDNFWYQRDDDHLAKKLQF